MSDVLHGLLYIDKPLRSLQGDDDKDLFVLCGEIVEVCFFTGEFFYNEFLLLREMLLYEDMLKFNVY
jgi:hypothetical protein